MNEELQHKLFHFEAMPPAKAWNNISEALDASSEEKTSERLYQYEATPPVYLWNNIERELDQDSVPVIPISKSYAKVLRYGSAAAVLIAIVFGVNLLLNKKTPDIELSHADTAIKQQGTKSPQAQELNQPKAESTAVFFAKTGQRDLKQKTARKRKTAIDPLIPLQAADATDATSAHVDEIIPKEIPIVQSNLPDRYIIFSTATGEAIRLSKKLFSLFACSDEVEDCKENIESLQEQMASPTLMASTDFNGILDLLQNMNKQ